MTSGAFQRQTCPRLGILLWALALTFGAASARAQVCETATGMDASTRSALETASKRFYDLATQGNTPAIQQNSIPSVAGSFSGIESAIKDNQTFFASTQATPRPPFLLTADGTAPLARAEFLCGVFGANGQTANSTIFVLNNLPPGKYGVVVLDVKSPQASQTLTFILQQVNADWKLAGFYARQAQLNGHDSAWFAQRAREFKAKGQTHNAWLYFREAIALGVPVDFMSTLNTDKLYDEAQSVQPADVPINNQVTDLTGDGKTYKLTALFPVAVGNDLDLVVKYQAADISNTTQTFQENAAVMKALLTKFPEFREAFAGVVARAVEPSGKDYGSMMPMKEIK